MIAGTVDDVDGGFGFEYLSPAVTCIQNFIAKDPKMFLSKADDQELSYHEMTYKFVQRVLVINSNSNAKLDGVSVLKVIVTIFENLPGQLDFQAMNLWVGMLLAELKHLLSMKKPVECYKSMLL